MSKSKSVAPFVARKNGDSEVVNFIAYVAGMVTTLMLMLGLWSYFTAPDPVRQAMANVDQAKDGTLNQTASVVNTNDFQQILERGNADQLEELLKVLNNWNRSVPVAVMVDSNMKRSRVASRMLELKLNNTQRSLAIDAQISSLSTIYGLDLLNQLGLPDVGVNLLAAAKQHISDPNPEIARSARLAVLKVETYDYCVKSGRASSPAPVAAKIADLLHAYSGDDIVLSNIELIVFSLIHFNPDFAIRLMRELSKHESEFGRANEQEFFGDMHDEIIMLDHRFEQLHEDRWVNGKAGQRELLKELLAMAADTTGGTRLLSRIDQSVNWFEEQDQLDAASLVYQSMVDSASARKSPAASTLAKKLGTSGLKRSKLVGQPLNFVGTTSLGGELDSDALSQQVTLVIFWSVKNPGSVRIFGELNRFAAEMKQRKASILAVSIDTTRQPMHLELANEYRNFIFLDPEQGELADRSILSQCPATMVPQYMLINHHGIVDDVNVPLDELRSSMDFLLIKQSEN